MSPAPARLKPRYRWAVASRCLAAAAGGYGVAVLASIASAMALPLDRAEASVAGVLAGLVVWPIAVMACFRTRSAARAWRDMALAASLLAAVAMIAGWRP